MSKSQKGNNDKHQQLNMKQELNAEKKCIISESRLTKEIKILMQFPPAILKWQKIKKILSAECQQFVFLQFSILQLNPRGA